MDIIQLMLIHSVIIGGFIVAGAILKISSNTRTRISQQKRRMQRAFPKFALLVGVCLFAGGCGKTSDRIAVNGQVTLDGMPIPNGSIILKPKDRGPQVGTKIVDGKYSFERQDGPLPGKYRVEIYQDDEETFPMDDPKAFAKQADEDPSVLIPENKVPEQFNRLSKLTAEAKNNNQTINFKLETRH